MHYFAKSIGHILIAWLSLCLSLAAAVAQEPKKDAQATTPPAAETTLIKPGNVADAADLEAFFDGVLPVQMESKHIAGAVVAVVVGDKLVFSKGYGYADVDTRQKVDPDKTMFRIASISKLFTWTAAMQQFEEGKLDLDADVNKYLKDVQIPATFEQPVTLKHLMAHTPGFDDWVIGLFGHKAEDVHPLTQVLKDQMPSRVRPPGTLPSYSNHGTAMAGAVVASVSGLPWEDYVEQRLLQPLGMQHTLVRQPTEDKLPPELSKGYKWEGGRFKSKGFEYIPAAPAGCISASAGDMAKFMLAHLHDGQLGTAHILKSETAKLMHSPMSRPNPKTSAMCYGFWEQECNGQRVIGHGGDTMWFHSLLQLIPERGVGIFVSYNTDTSGGEREALFNAFMRRYFPAPDSPRVQASAEFAERAKRITGEYASTRYSHTSLTKLSALLGVIKVASNKDDTITLSAPFGSRRLVEVEPYVFRELNGSRKVVFQEDRDGDIAYIFMADAPAISAVRRLWYERQDVQLGLLAGCLAVFASALLFWPALAFTVRGGVTPQIKRNWRSGLLSCLAWLSCLASLGFVVGVGIVLVDPEEIAFGVTPMLKKLLALPQVCVALAAVTVLGCLIAWINRYWRVSGRLHYTLVALAGVGFVAWLHYWNLLTFGFRDLM
jgi:CubicO group peptidase (beta-lactamase class C family)